jgi:hypothetical protein
VALVITQGKLIYPKEIDRALGIVPFVNQVPQLQTLSSGKPEGVATL